MIRRADDGDAILGIAWYSPSQWQRLLEISSDAAHLEETYEEWRAVASEKLHELRQLGCRVEKVPIDVDELLRWCQLRGLEVNGEARADYAAEKLEQKHQHEE